MKYEVSNNFTRINSSGGTIQNLSSSKVIEVSNSNTLGSGVLIKPFESISFSGNVYVRCPAGGLAEVRVVPFNAAASSSSSGDSSGDSTYDPIDDIWNDTTGDSTGDSTQSYDPDWDSELDNIFNP